VDRRTHARVCVVRSRGDDVVVVDLLLLLPQYTSFTTNTVTHISKRTCTHTEDTEKIVIINIIVVVVEALALLLLFIKVQTSKF